jgi:hypothetical protein
MQADGVIHIGEFGFHACIQSWACNRLRPQRKFFRRLKTRAAPHCQKSN